MKCDSEQPEHLHARENCLPAHEPQRNPIGRVLNIERLFHFIGFHQMLDADRSRLQIHLLGQPIRYKYSGHSAGVLAEEANSSLSLKRGPNKEHVE